MKYAIFGIVLAVFGLAEYTFVEVVPWPKKMRMSRFVNLPYVKPIADPILDWQEVRRVEKAIEEGPPWTYYELYRLGNKRDDASMKERALGLLRSSNTASADHMIYTIENGPGKAPFGEWSVERMALFLRSVQENLRYPNINDEAFARITKGNMEFVETYYRNAESGDERARQIVARLEELARDSA